MTIFSALGVAGTGMVTSRKWLDAISDNLANINDVSRTSDKAYQARYIEAKPLAYGADPGGVQVSGVLLGSAAGRTVYMPDHPLADKDGYVRTPDIDMASQMTQLIMAQRGYQANVAALDRAKAAYETALAFGK